MSVGIAVTERSEPDLDVCYHEAGHAVVGLAVGLTVEFIEVSGDSGLVMFCPDTDEFSATGGWAHLCMTVGGEVAEFLFGELSDSETGTWPTPEERARPFEILEAFAAPRPPDGRRAPSSASEIPRPEGEPVDFFKFINFVSVQLWLGAFNAPETRRGTRSTVVSDSSFALRHAGDALFFARTPSGPIPFAVPSDRVDEYGFGPEFRLIRAAEAEAEMILKREWDRVEAVVRSLLRRRNHRMSGAQLAALLRPRKL